MTRKRFIKLLMSKGVPRNKANAIADIVRICQMKVSFKVDEQ